MDIRRASERFSTQIDWLDSKHSFSFGRHYDPTNTHHGLLLVNNDDLVQPGTGILHSEKNDSWRLTGERHSEPVHFVQMWVVPDEAGITPGYEQVEIEH